MFSRLFGHLFCGCANQPPATSNSSLVSFQSQHSASELSSVILWEEIFEIGQPNSSKLDEAATEYASEIAFALTELDVPIVHGPINGAFRERMAQALNESDIIALSSPGGDTETAFSISQMMSEHGNLTLLVFALCNLNCLEILLPSADKVILVGRPLIGVHGNAASMLSLVKAGGGDDESGND